MDNVLFSTSSKKMKSEVIFFVFEYIPDMYVNLTPGKRKIKLSTKRPF